MSAERGSEPSTVSALVVVTGLSGAGKTTCLHALSDAGYYCVDNLPPKLAAATVRVVRSGGIERVALGMDVRVGAFLDSADEAIEALQLNPSGLEVTFLDASDEALVRRFSETRRPHPMLADVGAGPEGVIEGVKRERARLASIRGHATLEIDTSHMTVHDLRREILARFSAGASGIAMHTRIMSFGFKHGAPLDADLVFDVRFLDNPHFDPALRDKTGDMPEVRDFVLGSPGCEQLLEHLEALMRFTLPLYEREGKSYLTVAIGCTGGRHRSVAVAGELARRLSEGPHQVGILHRDAARGAMIEQVSAMRRVEGSQAASAEGQPVAGGGGTTT